MARRYRQRADIWFTTRTAAVRWGRQQPHPVQGDGAGRPQELRIRGQEPLPLFEAALTD